MAKAKGKPKSGYEGYRESQAAMMREQSTAGREIGPIPKCANPRRRKKGMTDPEFFNRTYFPNRFYLGFGDVHREAMAVLAECTTRGGLFAFAMQRGGGKSNLAECEVMRAVLYGLRKYVLFIGATDALAGNSIVKIFREFESNPLLLEDFPEVCYPIRALERINQRCKGQTLNGEPTRMKISEDSIILPTVPKSLSSGAAIQSFGMTGAFKGLSILGPDGTPIRPDLVIIDDAQSRESAGSVVQTNYRERLILDDILGLAGPTTEMAAAFLCTPVFPNDLSERFVDREKKPEWNGKKTRMVIDFPKNMKLWEEYAEIRADGFRAEDKGQAANKFYEERRAEMDEGCVLAWPERKKEHDLSSVQTAMNLYLTNPIGFASEYQCEPEANATAAAPIELNADKITMRFNQCPRGAVPRECTRLTASIDVHGEILFYCVTGWDEKFGGAVVDYGTWPQQSKTFFTQADPSPALSDKYPNISDDGRIFAGLRDLFAELLGRDYPRAESGEPMRVERCMVDMGWKPDVVFQAARQSLHASVILPSKGYAVSASAKSMSEWAAKPGEKRGYNWRVGFGTGGSRGKACIFEPNTWKTFVAERLLTEPGAAGCLQLFGSKAYTHQLFAAHLCAEYTKEENGRSGRMTMWKPKPGGGDNHWLDCLVGTAVAASISGLNWSGAAAAGIVTDARVEPRKKLSLRERYEAKHGKLKT